MTEHEDRPSAECDPWIKEIGFIPHRPGQPEAINADSFDEDVLQAIVPVFVEFWAARCGPCRRLAPELSNVAAMIGDRARVYTVNVDEELPAAQRFRVHAIPSVLLFADGLERERVVGITTSTILVNLLRPYINTQAMTETGVPDDW